MERDIVFSHELVDSRVLPVSFPVFYCSSIMRILCHGNVRYRGIHPHIKYQMLISFQRHFHAPFEVARYASRLETIAEPAEREIPRILMPVVLPQDPLFQLFLKQRKIKEQMLLVPEFYLAPLADIASRILQLLRV